MEEEELLQEEEQPEPVEDLANSQEEGLTEIVEDEAELDQHDALTDEAVETVEALEALREHLRVSLESGGLDQSGAGVLDISLKHMYRRLGVKTVRVMPALESFGSIARRSDATKIAMEEVGEQVRKAWDTIMAAIRKAIEWVKGFIKKLFDNVEAMTSRAKSLKEAAGKIEGEPREREIKNSGLASALHIGGRVPNDASASARVLEVTEKLFGAYGKLVDGIKQAALNPDKLLDESAGAEFAKNFTPENFGMQPVHDPSSQGIPAAEGAVVGRSAELPGGKAIVMVVTPSLDGSNAGLLPFNRQASEFKGEAVPVLGRDGAGGICDNVIKLGDVIRQKQSLAKESESAKAELVRVCEKAARSEDGKAGAVKAVRGLLKLLDAPFVAMTSYAVKTGKSLNQHVEQSIRAYGPATGGATEEKKEEEKAAA
jgi:phiKZ-like phage internal head proteins